MRGGIKTIGAVVAGIGESRVMASRYDLKAISEYQDKATGERKTRYTKIGVAFATKDGSGFVLRFDALPKADVLMAEPKDPTP